MQTLFTILVLWFVVSMVAALAFARMVRYSVVPVRQPALRRHPAARVALIDLAS
jgi:hypothetical protein